MKHVYLLSVLCLFFVFVVAEKADAKIDSLLRENPNEDAKIDSVLQENPNEDAKIDSVLRANPNEDSKIDSVLRENPNEDAKIDSGLRENPKEDAKIDSVLRANPNEDSKIDSVLRENPNEDAKIDSGLRENPKEDAKIDSVLRANPKEDAKIDSVLRANPNEDSKIDSVLRENPNEDAKIDSVLRENPNEDAKIDSVLRENPKADAKIDSGLRENPNADAKIDVKKENGGSSYDFNGRYYFHKTALDWNLAAQYCRGNMSHLAYPDTLEELATLEGIMEANSVQDIHIGMHNLYKQGVYYTIQGNVMSDSCYTEWAPGYPTGDADNRCGGYTQGEGLKDEACGEILHFICEKNLWWDFDLLPNLGYYKYHEEYLPWSNATAACEAEDSHLLVLHSAEEYTELLDKYSFSWCWVGLNQILENREFITIFDEPLYDSNFTSWYQGEPSGLNTKYPYVKLAGNEGLFTSYDDAPFICQHEIM